MEQSWIIGIGVGVVLLITVMWLLVRWLSSRDNGIERGERLDEFIRKTEPTLAPVSDPEESDQTDAAEPAQEQSDAETTEHAQSDSFESEPESESEPEPEPEPEQALNPALPPEPVTETIAETVTESVNEPVAEPKPDSEANAKDRDQTAPESEPEPQSEPEPERDHRREPTFESALESPRTEEATSFAVEPHKSSEESRDDAPPSETAAAGSDDPTFLAAREAFTRELLAGNFSRLDVFERYAQAQERPNAPNVPRSEFFHRVVNDALGHRDTFEALLTDGDRERFVDIHSRYLDEVTHEADAATRERLHKEHGERLDALRPRGS